MAWRLINLAQGQLYLTLLSVPISRSSPVSLGSKSTHTWALLTLLISTLKMEAKCISETPATQGPKSGWTPRQQYFVTGEAWGAWGRDSSSCENKPRSMHAVVGPIGYASAQGKGFEKICIFHYGTHSHTCYDSPVSPIHHCPFARL
jgi:hypothetical protein